MPTRILPRSVIEGLLGDPAAVLRALAEGFAARPDGLPAPVRARTPLPAPGASATALLPGLLPGVPAYTVKANAKFPGAAPALRGVVCLHAAADGELLALLDSATVTAWRTGLAAALATDRLARPDAARVAVVGAGAQARTVLRGLAALRPVAALTVHDNDPVRAAALAAEWGPAAEVRPTPAAAVADADIAVLATWSRTPLLHTADLRPGLHITALGADEPGKQELSAGLLRAARLVVDDVALALAMGAPGNAGLAPSAIAGTLGEVLRGELPGRQNAEQSTVYAPVGLPWQDLALAWPVFRAATAAGLGTLVDLLD